MGSSASKQLYDAAASNDVAKLRTLVKEGVDINMGTNGICILHVAAEKGHKKVITYLLDKGMDINRKTDEGRSPLYIAAKHGNAEAVRVLVERGADMESNRKNGRTALVVAAKKGNLEVVQYLVGREANMEACRKDLCTPLYMAAKKGHIEVAQFLIDSQANIEAQSILGITPLAIAAIEGHLDVVKYLLLHSPEFISSNQDGSTQIVNAAAQTYTDVAEAIAELEHPEKQLSVVKKEIVKRAKNKNDVWERIHQDPMTMGSSSGNSNLISPCTSDDSIDDSTKFELDTMAAYLVKDLDSGQSYRVEEIDQQYVTLEAMKEKLTDSHDLLALYSSDATTEVEIENVPDSDKEEDYVEHVDVTKHRSSELQPCQFAGCTLFHTRRSGYCETHEVRAKEEEDSRAQALYLIPKGRQASFVSMKGHSFVEDAMYRLYTVYTIELRCGESTWNVYRRYREFTVLFDKLKLRPRLRLPPLPPKKIIGSFEPEFLARRQYELGVWLDQLLTYDPLS
ncbi:kinase, partial [Thraustotheca clavata]